MMLTQLAWCGAAAPQIHELAEKACQRIPGMRLCPEDAEEGITHLILGLERRTMKVGGLCLSTSPTSGITFAPSQINQQSLDRSCLLFRMAMEGHCLPRNLPANLQPHQETMPVAQCLKSKQHSNGIHLLMHNMSRN